MTRLSFVVLGEAQPKGSTRALPAPRLMQSFKRGHPIMIRSVRELLGAIVVTSDNVDVKSWQLAIQKAAWCAIQELPKADRDLCIGAVALQVEFFLPRPSGLAKSHTGPHLKKPDLDKLVRAVKDALTDTAWHDDSQVTAVIAGKAYAGLGDQPRAVITVHVIDPPLFAKGPADAVQAV